MSEPASLPYRLLTGKDDQEFCERVSDALADGFVLYGSPSITRSDHQNYVCQAVVRP
ncbi:MAG: DUF1737 domain-containing protein [Acidimicrobiales bacterium]